MRLVNGSMGMVVDITWNNYDHFWLKETSTFKDWALDVVVRNRQII
jgi:hypothetical protein